MEGQGWESGRGAAGGEYIRQTQSENENPSWLMCPIVRGDREGREEEE